MELYKKIFDAYGENANKVLRQFRSDKNNVLRKKYVTSVINPNYDYDQLVKDIQKSKLDS